MKRVFFNWDRPFLPAVAEYVVRRYVDENPSDGPVELDLGGYVYVLSGQRAIRTLEAYLQRVVDREIDAGRIAAAWIPPTYVKLGVAPERLYSSSRRVADQLARLYCMRKTVEEFFRVVSDETRLIMKSKPANFAEQLELANTLLKLKDELDSERQTYARVSEHCLSKGLDDEARRWKILEKINASYEAKLKANKLTELNKARLSALSEIEERGAVDYGGKPVQYRVIGAVDLNNLQKSIFEKLGENVEFWVFAPEEDQDYFDEYGCVVPEKWAKRHIPLSVKQIYQANTPAEQGEVAALLTRELSKRYDGEQWTYEPIDPYSLTIGTPDDEVAPFIEQSMSDIGYDVIIGEGSPIVRNRVYKLLVNLAEYLETRSFDSFGELLRRVDLEEYLRANWKSVESAKEDSDEEPEAESENFDDVGAQDEMDDVSETPAEEAISGDWIADLDDYRARYLPTRVDGRWFQFKDPDDERRNRSYFNLRRASSLLNKLLCERRFWTVSSGPKVFERSNVVVTETAGDLDDLKADYAKELDAVLSGKYAFIKDWSNDANQWVVVQPRLPLNQWAQPLSDLLCEIYAKVQKSDRETENQIAGFFKSFNKALTSLAAIPDELSEKASGSEAIRVVLKQLANERIEPTPESEVVEMQGWLDLLFDDAPNLILTGFNEGKVPTNKSSDLFLPNDTRTQVGLSDSQRVYARDAYLTTALVNSRRNMFVVMGRRSLDGDPKLPSRFVFATDREEIPRRVVKFFGQEDADAVRRLRKRQLGADGLPREFPRKLKLKDVDDKDAASTGDSEIDALNAKSSRILREQVESMKKGFRAPTLDVRAQQAKKSRYNLSSINVTDFQTFLDSPYRFFLRKVFALSAAPPPNTFELDAGKFGTVIHDVLRIFGESDFKDSTDEHIIAQKLSDWLDDYAKSFVNEHTSPFVVVQIEQIRDRLRAFARWQAAWRKSGRVVKWVERAPKEQRISCRVGDKEFWINGRIDRIDYCSAENRWYLFDYKTFDKVSPGNKDEKNSVPDSASVANDVCVEGESGRLSLFSSRVGNTVDAKHRAKVKDGESIAERFLAKLGIGPAPNDKASNVANEGAYSWRWINLQLPLYRRLFWQILYEDKEGAVPMEQIASATKFALAYIVLPKSGDVQAVGGPWSERDLRAADATAWRVVRTIERMFQDVVSPNALVDPEFPELGRVLDNGKLKFSDDFAPITLSYAIE